MKIITVNPSKCAGCRTCELVCSLTNCGEFNPARACIQVAGFDELFSLPVMCYQCEKPLCAEVCPASAIVRDEATGTVKILNEKCVGCKICTLACPFGNIAFSSIKRVAVKCELCAGQPECVAFCPTGALEFGDADTALMYRKWELSEKLKEIYQGTK
jgi:carbon-monoxide dehydrogenase iron sulfur subunit